MIRKFLLLFTFSAGALSVYGQQNRSEAFTTAEMNFDGAWYFQKVPLNGNTMPAIRVTDQDYTAAGTSAVTDSMLALATQPLIRIGVERKKTFALVGIPAFRKDASGNLQKLQHFNLDISEKETAAASTAGPGATMRLSAPSSALANGSWHKIAIPARGVYKVDYAFVKNNLGTGTISSAAIRLFGNGGTILDENNNAPRYDDLTENALDMHDGGDGNFNEGDYFLFYANGPLDWQKDSSKQIFHHRTNLYADSSYYFITLDNGTGLRMQDAPDPGTATTSVNSYNDYALHEKEQRNLGYFGKIWWGEIFGFTGGLSSVQTFSFPSTNLVDTVRFEYNLASAATPLVSNAAAFTVKLNGATIGEHTGLQGIGGTDGDDVGVPVFNSGAVPTSGNSLDFTIQYFKYTADAKAYLDYIEVNMRRKLVMASGQQLSFRDWRSIGGAGAIARYNIDNAGTAVQVWDVTDPLRPQRINGSSSGSTYSFNQRASDLHEFIATEGTYPAPAYAGKVANQNLHGLGQQDYVIIAHEEYVEAANRLADFHRSNGLRVAVVPVGQVYNEFACGAKDISALRDFLRMFYDRAGTDESQMPKHLLLFGQASYDYKNIVPNNARIVPTYETPESLWANVGYCSDDFFGILDSTEFIDTGNALLDIGVGRLPATTVAEANDMVNKILRYKSPQALGPWRLNNIYVGDNEDGAGNHMLDADSMSKVVLNSSDLYTSVKVYLDNMNTISTPGGQRSPDANKAINDNIYKGTFLFNYSGHGSIYTLSKKRVLTQDDFKNWKNPYKLPVMITATCDFSRFDNPALQSAGEKLMIKGDGGAIALVTTTQVVYAEPNKRFNSAYLKFQFQKKADGWHSFGDAFRISKNSVLDVTSTNSRKFALLGDPALIPDFPRYNVATDSIQEMTDGGTIHADSVKSLGTYQVYGSVRDDAGNVMHDFNGKVNISFYDKPQIISVRTANSGNTYRKYNVQNNLIYKGIATVKNGAFSFSFITPKDINYDFGKGRISYYADNGTTDASGSDASVTVGGFSDNATTDNDGPLVRPFMNDSLFRDGGITGPSSVLYAIISDESGINISGNAVGHDLTAVLDDVVEVPYVLNDYYETAPNTYKRGYVNFPITGLTNGKHTLRVKAWDVFNNSGEGVVHFEVVDGSIVRVQNLRSYPNPFRDITHFVFDHNHPNEPLKATVHIFNTAGSLVSTLEQSFTPTGSRSAEVTWDGTDKGGAKLPAGVYPYRIRIATETNIEDLGYEKVVLIR